MALILSIPQQASLPQSLTFPSAQTPHVMGHLLLISGNLMIVGCNSCPTVPITQTGNASILNTKHPHITSQACSLTANRTTKLNSLSFSFQKMQGVFNEYWQRSTQDMWKMFIVQDCNRFREKQTFKQHLFTCSSHEGIPKYGESHA